MRSACVVLHCHLWPLRFYSIYPHYLINDTIFRKKMLLNTKCVFWFFSTNSVWKISHSKKNSARYYHTFSQVSCKVPVAFVRVWLHLNSLDIFSENNHHHHHKHQRLDLWSFPSPELRLLAATLLRFSNCSPSLWSVVVWFQRDSVLWHSLQLWKAVPSVFIYLL